jgi:excinuclease ABC subunit B
MMQASSELKFELAGKLRDEVVDLKRELRQLTDATG